jgi:hypothetical protein
MANTYIINWHTVNHSGEPGQFGTTLIEAEDAPSAQQKLQSLYPTDQRERIEVIEVKLYQRPGL